MNEHILMASTTAVIQKPQLPLESESSKSSESANDDKTLVLGVTGTGKTNFQIRNLLEIKNKMSIVKFLNNFFEKSKKEDLIAKKYNISFDRGLWVDGLCVGDFNYLAQSYSRHNLVEIAELLNMIKENRLAISAIIEEEMYKDSSTGNYREKVKNAKMNFDNFSKIIRTINNYADEVQQ